MENRKKMVVFPTLGVLLAVSLFLAPSSPSSGAPGYDAQVPSSCLNGQPCTDTADLYGGWQGSDASPKVLAVIVEPDDLYVPNGVPWQNSAANKPSLVADDLYNIDRQPHPSSTAIEYAYNTDGQPHPSSTAIEYA